MQAARKDNKDKVRRKRDKRREGNKRKLKEIANAKRVRGEHFHVLYFALQGTTEASEIISCFLPGVLSVPSNDVLFAIFLADNSQPLRKGLQSYIDWAEITVRSSDREHIPSLLTEGPSHHWTCFRLSEP